MECLTDAELFILAADYAFAMTYYFEGKVSMMLMGPNDEITNVLFDFVPRVGLYCTGDAG